MGKPAARLGDMHVCPAYDGDTPHTGGPISGPGVPTVLIGGAPAAVLGNMATCNGPPDTLVQGSTGVFIGGKPAARIGDSCAHGGKVVAGYSSVLIGESAPGAPSFLVVAKDGAMLISPEKAIAEKEQKKQTVDKKKKGWIEFNLVDPDNKPVPNERYKLELSDGTMVFGSTDDKGKVRIEGIEKGKCKISFPDLDASEWDKA